MQPFTNSIEQAVELIKSCESQRKALAKKAIEKSKTEKLPENALVFPVKKAVLNEKIAGVDSGFSNSSLLSIEIVLVRAIAAIFSYKNNKLEKCEYCPKTVSFPEPIITAKPLQKEDIGTNKSLQRLMKEIMLAIQTIKEFKPAYCFLDGSIIPQHADKPRNNSCMEPLYRKTIKCFEELFETAEKNNCCIVACVEDSRGTRMQEILGLEATENNICYDSMLLNYVLKEGQRSFAFPYSKNPEEHPVLKDFSEKYAKSINAFYLRASDFDLPLRIEFLSSKSADAEKIASVVLALSSGHREYSYPTVLIEADLHSCLKQEEINSVMDKIYCRLQISSGNFFRRNKRPF